VLITRKFIFVHIPKTAGKAIIDFLIGIPHEDFTPFECWRIKHLHLRERYADNNHKQIFCTIRNPWDWHVSSYYHNFLNGDAVRGILKEQGHKIDLNKPYEPVEIKSKFMNKKVFSEYIQFYYSEKNPLLTSPHINTNFDIPNVGQLTHRYFNMCSKQKLPKSITINEIYKRHGDLLGIDKVIKMESLPNGLFRFLRIPQTYRFKEVGGGHRLSNHRDHYSHYYDDEARKIIAEKEAFIIDKFNYKFQKEH
jgi:hypothetical protein